MTFTNAPAAPREPRFDHCGNGCAAHGGMFACEAKACPQDHLCAGCIWSCADCSGDFCEQHIEDATPESLTEQTFLCAGCLLKRQEAPKKPATQATGGEVLAWLPAATPEEIFDFGCRLNRTVAELLRKDVA